MCGLGGNRGPGSSHPPENTGLPHWVQESDPWIRMLASRVALSKLLYFSVPQFSYL